MDNFSFILRTNANLWQKFQRKNSDISWKYLFRKKKKVMTFCESQSLENIAPKVKPHQNET